jgi:acylphosphatase
MVCRRLLISGKVQGVSFRFHTCELAAKLKLLGFVRNLPDSRVEILVAGPLKNVEQLTDWATRGPSEAKVKDVKILEVTENFPTELFYIRREGGKP